MAEAIGTAIGVIGFLGQLFDGCVKAYGYFSTAAQMDHDSKRLLCKVRIEEMRLVVWGREWGVAEGKLEAHLKMERNPQMKQLATQIMTELYSTVTDFQKLQEKYGLLNQSESAENSQVFEGPGVRLGTDEKNVSEKESDPSSPPRKGGESSGRGHSRRASRDVGPDKAVFKWRREISLRARWVIAGMTSLPHD
jgi:Prion-inhibition and propagation